MWTPNRLIKGAAAFEGWADVPLAPMLARACGGGARGARPTLGEERAVRVVLEEGRRNVSMLTLDT